MRIQKFTLKNYKGIKKTSIDIGDGPPGNIITLIGLNESGKTTILEGIANFGTADPETRSLVGTIQEQQSPESFVPKARKGIFTGSISIEVDVILDPDDIAAAITRIKSAHDFQVIPSTFPTKVNVERRMTFSGGDMTEDRNYWILNFSATKGKSKKPVKISADNERPVWLSALGVIRDRIPRITYFPTFLFTFPERIYLRTPSDWDEESEAAIVNKYYLRVLQDVADSIRDPSDPNQRISIEKQVVERLESVKEPSGNVFAFWSYFTAQAEYDKVRAVINLLAQRMGQVIFPAWNKIFDKPTAGKRVDITFGTDPEKGNIPWIQISIFDGLSTYSLSERSLGFRWFFSFLLFTQFRKNRDIRSVFLFDEPASNLHSVAQMRLMEGFTSIVEDGSYIIYSTHSHYLVNPMWLEKAYIIKNAAVDYDKDLDLNTSSDIATDIEAFRYRSFVNSNPSRISYFQPALDALRFNLGPMVPRNNAVIVEGKFDFHPVEYLRRKFCKKSDFDIFPVNGAGDAAPIVSLFRGWGINYFILLDDDKAGRDAKKKYIKELAVPEKFIISVGDLHPSLSGKTFESLYGEEVKDLAKTYSKNASPTKRSFYDFFLDRTAKGDYSDKLGMTDLHGKELIVRLNELVKKAS